MQTVLDKKPRKILNEYDDWDLVRSFCNGDNECYTELVRRHYELVVNMSYRFFLDMQIARDNAQEVFLKVFHEIGNIKPGKQPFVHWLCRVTSNNCRSIYRKRNSEIRSIERGKVDFWHEEKCNNWLESNLDNETDESIRLVNEALKKICKDDRMILILTYIAELKTREIAKIEGIPEYTVRRKIKRAEKKLHKLVTQIALEKCRE